MRLSLAFSLVLFIVLDQLHLVKSPELVRLQGLRTDIWVTELGRGAK